MTRRIALIGLGWISIDPAGEASDPALGSAIPNSHASAIAAIPSLQIVAGCDIARAARERFLSLWSDRWPGLKVYADYQEMLESERPELVSVATPDHLHFGPIKAAVDTGARGIFCEKPLATNLDEADRIVAAVRAAGVTMNVDYTRRWMPEFVEARRLCRSGAVGRLSQIVIQTGGPRAMLFRIHTHLVDLLCFLADSDPEWVWGELEPGFEDYGTAYAGDGGNDPATEPGANYYIAFENGVRAYVTGVKDAMSDMVVNVIADRARIIIDGEGLRLVSTYSEDLRTKPPNPTVVQITPNWSVAGIQAALLDLLRAMDEGTQPASPPETARKAVAMVQAILLSQARGNVKVDLAELGPPNDLEAGLTSSGP